MGNPAIFDIGFLGGGQLARMSIQAAQRMGLKRPTLSQNWLAVEDVENLLRLAGLEEITRWQEVLWPVGTPGVDAFFNRFLVRFSPFRAAFFRVEVQALTGVYDLRWVADLEAFILRHIGQVA